MRIALVVFLLASCETKLSVTEPTKVSVDCETTKEALVCNAKQTLGTQEATACWEFQMKCGNGAIVTGPKSCITVKGGGTGIHTTPITKLTDLDKCGGEGPPTGSVTNFTINGQDPQKLETR